MVLTVLRTVFADFGEILYRRSPHKQLSMYEVRENWWSDNYTLITGIHLFCHYSLHALSHSDRSRYSWCPQLPDVFHEYRYSVGISIGNYHIYFLIWMKRFASGMQIVFFLNNWCMESCTFVIAVCTSVSKYNYIYMCKVKPNDTLKIKIAL